MGECHLILTLDGGGVRGALQAKLLERLEVTIPFLHNVSLIAGSSIGGINALCLAAGLTPGELVEFYEVDTAGIFDRRDWWDTIAGSADEVFRADYDNAPLMEALEKRLGARTLGDLDKMVAITSFDLDNADEQSKNVSTRDYARRCWKPKIFHNYDSPGNDKDQLAVDVGLRTSAAPTFFPSHQGYVDGGIVANNPSLVAVGRAVKAGCSLDDIVLLSIGAGLNPNYIEGDRLDWGYKQWVPHLLPMFMDGMVGLPDYVCRQLLPNRYVRLNPFLPEDVPLDDADKVDELMEWASEADLGPAVDLLADLPA